MTDQLQPIHHVYYGHDRKPCQVDVDGTWHDAEIRFWDRDEAGAWSASVAWSRGPGQSSYLERFPADGMREP